MANFLIPRFDAANYGITGLENSAGIRDPQIAIPGNWTFRSQDHSLPRERKFQV